MVVQLVPRHLHSFSREEPGYKAIVQLFDHSHVPLACRQFKSCDAETVKTNMKVTLQLKNAMFHCWRQRVEQSRVLQSLVQVKIPQSFAFSSAAPSLE